MTYRMFVGAALLAMACSSQAAVMYGSNLVVNGDAEAGMSGWSGFDSYSPVQSVNYGSNWVLPSQPGPVDRGNSMFAGSGGYAVAYQSLDFGVTLAQGIAYSLSGWLGGWANQGDNAVFYVQFLDEFNNEVGSSALGPVTPQDRGNQTGLLYREADGLIPAGTRSLSFWLSMERLVSGDNDGYADNLSFVLDAPSGEVPEPSTVALLLAGLGMLGWGRRRTTRYRPG